MSFYWNEIHHNALYSLFVIFDNAFAIYGLGLMFTSLIGIFAYLLLMKRKKEFLFGVLFLALLLTPVLGDYLALFQGSGAMFPVSNPAVKDLFQGLDNRLHLNS